MIYTGDCRNILPTLERKSVDCIVTSPPYYQLRKYGMEGEIGSEQQSDDYLNNLVDVFLMARNILKPTGTMWINIGDSYHKGKLRGLPWKLVLALMDEGMILRQDIIWSKPNPMPESIRNRCTKAHEYIFLFTRDTSNYFFDIEPLKEKAVYDAGMAPNIDSSIRYGGTKYTRSKDTLYRTKSGKCYQYTGTRHPRSVWNIATQPFDGDHFSTFPEELPRRCILAGCPPGGVVLDPFCGSGTTGKVAYDLGREFIGIELNPAYAAMAEKRIGTTKQAQLDYPEGFGE